MIITFTEYTASQLLNNATALESLLEGDIDINGVIDHIWSQESSERDLVAKQDFHFSQDIGLSQVGIINDMKEEYEEFQRKPKCNGILLEQVTDSVDQQPIFQSPRFPADMYTPQWTRGSGIEREGRCSICCPPIWLRLKQSAYWYHMNFVHGISSTSGKPYPEPETYRFTSTHGELVRCEGWCLECKAWRVVGSRSKNELFDLLGDEILDGLSRIQYRALFPHTNWYKHCQKQHKL